MKFRQYWKIFQKYEKYIDKINFAAKILNFWNWSSGLKVRRCPPEAEIAGSSPVWIYFILAFAFLEFILLLFSWKDKKKKKKISWTFNDKLLNWIYLYIKICKRGEHYWKKETCAIISFITFFFFFLWVCFWGVQGELNGGTNN